MTLLDQVHRREYDVHLGKATPALPEYRPSERRDTPVVMQDQSTPAAVGEDGLVLLISAGGPCDLKLVHRRLAA